MGRAIPFGIASLYASWQEIAFAQIAPDNTLGAESSVVTPDVINGILSDRIDSGAIRGSNLFHSFQEFNVGEGRGAYFTNPAGIENILSRVTGGNPSNILGTLGVLGNANLFLINPNGIIFGSNARLDLKGSFVGSTASSLTFADGNQFSATNPQGTVTLTVSVPLGLQFGQTARDIRSQGATLTVNPGKTLALVGGNVTLEGGLMSATGGRVELGSVGKDSLVSLSSVSNGWALGYNDVQNFQDIQLSQGSLISAREPEGSVTIAARQLSLRDGTQVSTTTFGTGNAGELIVRTSESIELRGRTADGQFASGLFSRVNSGAEGTGGDLTIETKKLIVRDGALVSTSTDGTGRAGNLTIRASESVELSGTGASGSRSGVFAEVNPNAIGNGGNLRIETGKLTVENGAQVSTTTSGIRGDAGDIAIRASSIELIGPDPEIGSIVQQGNRIIYVLNPVTNNTGLFTRVEAGEGTGGDLNIETEKLTIRNGALLSATTFAAGNAGNLNIRSSDAVELDDGSGLFARVDTNARGNGGNITINTGELIVRDRSVINVSSAGGGIAGDINVKARSIQLNNRGALIAENASGRGGNIALDVQDLLLLRRNSLISTTAGTAGAGGDGGNIRINGDFIVAVPSENSDITANAFQGRGGNIEITAQEIFGLQPQERLTSRSDITASSELGIEGTVRIETPDFDVNRELARLPEEIVNTSGLIAQGCQTLGEQAPSRFRIRGSGKLPSNPVEELGNELSTEQSRVVEAQGWVRHPNEKGVLYFTAQAQTPTTSSYSSWASSTACYDP